MNRLSPHTRALLDQAREQLDPQNEDLLRLRAKLKVTLASSPQKNVTSAWLLPFKVMGGLALAFGALLAWQRFGPLPPPEQPAVASASLTCPPAAPQVACPPVPECPAPVPPAALAPAPVPNRCPPPAKAVATSTGTHLDLFSMPLDPATRGGLEVGLLTDARIALDEGRPIGVLGHVQRHQQLFPRSSFEEERLALEVLAYCALDRRSLAAPRLTRLLELAPESTYLPRVRGACGDLSQVGGKEDAGDED